MRIIILSQYYVDIRMAFFLDPFSHILVHFLINIHRIHFTGGSHRLGQSVGKITASRPQVGNMISRLNAQGLNYPLGKLPCIAVCTFIGKSFKSSAT